MAQLAPPAPSPITANAAEREVVEQDVSRTAWCTQAAQPQHHG